MGASGGVVASVHQSSVWKWQRRTGGLSPVSKQLSYVPPIGYFAKVNATSIRCSKKVVVITPIMEQTTSPCILILHSGLFGSPKTGSQSWVNAAAAALRKVAGVPDTELLFLLPPDSHDTVVVAV